MAFALERAPSSEGPVEAPVRTPIWNSCPALWAAMARSAIASGIALGAPAGVNPLKPTFCPWWIKEAASAAVSTGNVIKSLFARGHRWAGDGRAPEVGDRKSTRLNSSHLG